MTIEKYNPDQPRDEDGKFGEGSGGGEGEGGSGGNSLSTLVVNYSSGGTHVNVGPMDVTVFRAGPLVDSGRGIFFADEKSSADMYGTIRGDTTIEYDVSVLNPIVTASQMSLYRHLYGENKSFQDAVYAEDRKLGFKNSVLASAKVEAKMAAKVRSLKHDAIIYTKPPAPAKAELSILSPKVKISRKSGVTKGSTPRTLYVRRNVLNAAEIIKWAKDQGFDTTLPADDMHVTICYSKTPVDWMKVPEDYAYDPDGEGKLTIKQGGPRIVELLGDKGAVVLMFSCSQLAYRHEDLKRVAGATSDYDNYQPHVTITYTGQRGVLGAQLVGEDLNLADVEPYVGEIVLGPEIFEEIDPQGVLNNLVEKGLLKIVKVDEDAHVVYGWASVISEGGVPYVDNQGDIIAPAELVRATTEFMEDARVAKAMHDGDSVGEVVHSFPLTSDIAKSLGIELNREGWIVGVKVKSEAVWKRVKSGELGAFSIGAQAVREMV